MFRVFTNTGYRQFDDSREAVALAIVNGNDVEYFQPGLGWVIA